MDDDDRMKILCAFWKYQYGTPSRGTGIEYESFLPAFKNLGHEVRHFETWDQSLYSDYGALNRALLAEVEAFQPDVVFTVQRDYEIWIETLEAIHGSGHVALATWTTDDSFKFSRVSRFIGPHYDAIGTTYDYRVADYRAAGIEGVYLTQWAANAHWLNPPKPASECRYGVSFIGSAYGAREKMIAELRSSGIEVECFGYGWPNGSVATDEIPAIMRDSVVSLNFTAGFISDGGHDRQIKARTFEVPGAGGFLLTEDSPGLDTVYALGKEIDIFKNMEELIAKIRYYLANPDVRDRVARAGYERTKRCHTYDQRLKGLIELAVAQQKSSVIVAASPWSFCDAERSYRVGSLLRLFRKMLVSACVRVWGVERGPKAARRFIFETSLKVMGSGTFRASGLPGRMFPFV